MSGIDTVNYETLTKTMMDLQDTLFSVESMKKAKRLRLVKAIRDNNLIESKWYFDNIEPDYKNNLLSIHFSRESGYETYCETLTAPLGCLDNEEELQNWVAQKVNVKKINSTFFLIQQKQKEIDEANIVLTKAIEDLKKLQETVCPKSTD